MKSKKVIAGIVALAMLFGYMPLYQNAIPDEKMISVKAEGNQGTCGENLTWQYDEENRVLEINGTGAMDDYKVLVAGGAPWRSFASDVATIIVGEGVTSIGNYAFKGCTGANVVYLPNTLEHIGNNAFEECWGIFSIIIPESVKTSGENVFAYTNIQLIYGYRGTAGEKIANAEGINFVGLTHEDPASAGWGGSPDYDFGGEYLDWYLTENGTCVFVTKKHTDNPLDEWFQLHYGHYATLDHDKKYCLSWSVRSSISGAYNPYLSGEHGDDVYAFWDRYGYAYGGPQDFAIDDYEDNLTNEQLGEKLFKGYQKSKNALGTPDSNNHLDWFGVRYHDGWTYDDNSGWSNGWQSDAECFKPYDENGDYVLKLSIPSGAWEHCTSFPTDVDTFLIIDLCNAGDYFPLGSIVEIGGVCLIELSDDGESYTVLDPNGYKPSEPPSTTPETTATTTATTTTTTATTSTTKPTTTTKTTTTTVTTTTSTATTATTTPTETVPTSAKFVDGKNNWSFANTSSNFGNNYFIKKEYLDELMKGATRTEKRDLEDILSGRFQGACYGMACTSILSCYNILKASDYQKDATCLFDIGTPLTDDVKSLINYYFALQVMDGVRQHTVNALYYKTEKEKIDGLLQQIKENPTLLTFFMGRGGGHAVVAYDAEYGVFKQNNKEYNVKVITYDNNAVYRNDSYCLYANTKDGSWIIPAYSGLYADSTKGGRLGLTTNKKEIINYHGYLSDDSAQTMNTTTEFIPILASKNIDSNYSVRRISLDGDSWTINSGSDDDIKSFSSFTEDIQNPDLQFAISGNKMGCYMQFEKNQEADMFMRYQNDRMQVNFADASHVVFDPSGYAEVAGKNSDYTIDFISNDGYAPTDWYEMKVSGTAGEVIMKKADDGYILKSDSLQKVKLNAISDNANPRAKFSTDASEVYIYEIDENTIGVSVDTDGDGKYETALETSSYNRTGDIDGDDKISIVDVLALNQYLLGIADDITEDGIDAGDVDGDKNVTDSDAMTLLKSLVGLATIAE